jgi:hypothetical protein
MQRRYTDMTAQLSRSTDADVGRWCALVDADALASLTGAERTRLIMRLFARWCVLRPGPRSASHLRVLLLDALVRSRGAVRASALAVALHLPDVRQVLREVAAAADAWGFLKFIPIDAASSGSGDAPAADGTVAHVAEDGYVAVDYARALPRAYVALMTQWALLVSTHEPALAFIDRLVREDHPQLRRVAGHADGAAARRPDACLDLLTHLRRAHREAAAAGGASIGGGAANRYVRWLECAHCGAFVVWDAAGSTPLIMCTTCGANAVRSLLERVVMPCLDAVVRKERAALMDRGPSDGAALAALVARLPPAFRVDPSLCARARLIVCLFSERFVALTSGRAAAAAGGAAQGGEVIHPDRIMTASEFEATVSQHPSVRMARFEEPAGATERALPGLVIRTGIRAAPTEAHDRHALYDDVEWCVRASNISRSSGPAAPHTIGNAPHRRARSSDASPMERQSPARKPQSSGGCLRGVAARAPPPWLNDAEDEEFVTEQREVVADAAAQDLALVAPPVATSGGFSGSLVAGAQAAAVAAALDADFERVF